MRYDPKTFERHEPADDAALQPVLVEPVAAPQVLPPCPNAPYYAAPSAPDVPVAVGGLIAAFYVALIAALAIATTGSRRSMFAIVIAGFLIAIFFAVPRIFLGVEPRCRRRPTLNQFIQEGMGTLTGHCSGSAALVQMLVVPACLTLGVSAMGVIAAIYF